MAKKRRKAKTRRATSARRSSYVHNPAPRKKSRKRRAHAAPVAHRKRKHYRRNPGMTPALKSLALGGLGGLVGAIGVPKGVSMLPGSPTVKNWGMLVAGLGATVAGLVKDWPILTGFGAGTAFAGGSRIATNALPMLAGEGEFTQEESLLAHEELAAPALEGEEPAFLGAPAMAGAPAFAGAPAQMFGNDPFGARHF